MRLLRWADDLDQLGNVCRLVKNPVCATFEADMAHEVRALVGKHSNLHTGYHPFEERDALQGVAIRKVQVKDQKIWGVVGNKLSALASVSVDKIAAPRCMV